LLSHFEDFIRKMPHENKNPPKKLLSCQEQIEINKNQKIYHHIFLSCLEVTLRDLQIQSPPQENDLHKISEEEKKKILSRMLGDKKV
jgi:hypothetical protein